MRADAASAVTAATRAPWRAVAALTMAMAAGLAVPSTIAGRIPIGALLALAMLAALPLILTGPREWMARQFRIPATLAALAMLALWLVPALRTLRPEVSLLWWAQTALLLWIAVGLARALAAAPDALDVALKALVLGGAAAVAVALTALHLWPAVLGPFKLLRIETAGAAQAALKPFGSALALLAPAAVWAGWRLGGAWRWLGLAVAAGALAATFGARSYSGLLGFGGAAAALGFGWALARMPRRALPFAVAGLIALIAGAAIFVVGRLPDPAAPGREALRLPVWLIDPHRQMIWGFVWHHAGDAPWFGVGIGAAGRIAGAKALVPWLGQEIVPSHPHDWPLQILIETGALGLASMLLALGLYVAWLIAAWRRGALAAAAALAIAGAYFAAGLVNFSFFAAWWQACFVALSAIAAAAITPRSAK